MLELEAYESIADVRGIKLGNRLTQITLISIMFSNMDNVF